MAKQWTTSAGRTFKTKIYVGLRSDNNRFEMFRSVKSPTVHSHKEYAYALGPFRTLEGAEVMVKHGKPYDFEHLTVTQAERHARYDTVPNPTAGKSKIVVAIRPKEYRGDAGFIVYGRETPPPRVYQGQTYQDASSKIGPIFVRTREGADAIRDAVKTGDRKHFEKVMSDVYARENELLGKPSGRPW